MVALLFLEQVLKAESHCSNNENDNNHDPKRTHSIGLIAQCRIRPRSFNQLRACIVNILVFVLVIEPCVSGQVFGDEVI